MIPNLKAYWNRVPYWLKGGIVATVVFCLVVAKLFVENDSPFDLLFVFMLIPFFLSAFIVGLGVRAVILMFAVYFAIGSFLGWIYGKIKK